MTLLAAILLAASRLAAQSSITAAFSPVAIAGGGGPGSLGTPYAVFVRIQGWTTAAGATAFLKIYSGTTNEYMWTGTAWSNLTAFDPANQPVVTIDASGNWSGWIYAKHTDALGSSASVRAAKTAETSVRLTAPLPTFSVLTTTVSGNGGWISRSSSAAVNMVIGAYSGGTLVGTYRSEENGIAEGHALGAGGFRIAVPAGTVDSLVAWNDDGTRSMSFTGPWPVSPGVETEATTGGTAFGNGRAAVVPSVLPGGAVTALAVRLHGEAPAVLRSARVIVPAQWNWSRTPADVTAPGTVTVSGDSITVGGFTLSGTDSIDVQIQNIVPPDSTGPFVFRVFTGGSADSLLPIATQPTLFVYSTPLPISSVKENDASGIPARLNRLVTVRGVITVANEFGGPSYMQDNSGGLAVFGAAFSTAVTIGDEVIVSGVVDQFNGLTELAGPTIHRVVGSGNIVEPQVTTVAHIAGDGQGGVELYEGRLVRLNGVTVTGSGTWAYQNYTLSDATGSTQIRIDNNTTLIGTPVPAGAFDLIGAVGQFIGSSPYIGGYQVMPRRTADVISSGPIIATFPVETDITPASLTIGWTTVHPGTSVAFFGKTPALELGAVLDTLPVTSHSLRLEALEPATIYYVRVFSTSGQDTSFASTLVTSTASPPQATGAIHVYFNQSVDTTVAWSERALGKQNLAQRLIARVNAARRSVDVAVYSLSGTPGPGSDIANALVAARARGVSVRLICEGDNRNTAPFTILASGGVPVIDDRLDAVNAGQGLMHNKFFVFDARGGAPESVWVVTGSWNPTIPGTFNDYQNVIEIQDPALAGAYLAEFNEMWGSTTESPNAALSRFGARKSDNTPHRFVIGGSAVECYFSPSDRTTSRIQSVIDGAGHSLAFGLLTFTRSDLKTAIVSRHLAGTKVRGIMDNNSDSGTQFAALQAAGVDLLLKPSSDSLFHHKYLIADGENPWWNPVVLTGSHNWSNSAETSNNENTLILRSGRIAGLYLQEFSARYRQFGGQDPVVVAVGVPGADLPAQTGLLQNYPNPFNPATTIPFTIAVPQHVILTVYDLLGREVRVLQDGPLPAGRYAVRFEAGSLASGVYLYRLQARSLEDGQAGGTVETRRFVLIR